MKKYPLLIALVISGALFAENQLAYSHDDIKQFSMHGNFQKALASKEMGAKEFEVWRASLAVGGRTPKHVHESEEVFLVLKGEILAIVGDKEVRIKAPGTLICPANVPHQLINVGNEPTDQILVLGIDSKIFSSEGEEMDLPWR